MAKLTRLKIEKFRNVEPVELRFGGGFNVLLGLNATGKTTLLGLIAAILSDDFSELREEEFAIEYDLTLQGAEFTASLKSESIRQDLSEGIDGGLPMRMRAEILRAEPKRSAEIRVRVGEPAVEYIASADASGITIQVKDGPASPPLVLPVPLSWHIVTSALILIEYEERDRLVKIAAQYFVDNFVSCRLLCRFDESLEFFRLITRGPEHGAKLPARAPLMTLMKDRQRPAVVSMSGDFLADVSSIIPLEVKTHARDILAAQAASEEPIESLAMRADSLDFLARVVGILGFKSGELQIRLLEKKAGKTHDTWSFGDFRFMLERADGSIVSHDRLSYGQKRLLAFFYYLAANPNTVVADELVDGLHHRWIQECIQAIGDRQAFLASQNPLLFDYLEFESPADVRSSFVLCRLEMREGTERMVWSNMSEYDAERFFAAYQVGIQHVSEILVDKGLW